MDPMLRKIFKTSIGIFLLIILPLELWAEGTVTGQLSLKNSWGKQKKDASNCFVYIFGKDYVEKGEGIADELPQQKKNFTKRSVAIVQGASIDFPNRDPIYHNVFSSSAKLDPRLDLGHYKKSTKQYQFNQPGNYQLFCNIHPNMVSNVLVLPNKAFARVKPDGSFRIENVRDGDWFIGVWSPSAKAPSKAPVKVLPGKVVSANLELTDRLPEVPEHTKKDGESYEDDNDYP
jgi:plastocyanin